MRVRAKKMCFAEGHRRRKGAEFSLHDEANFSNKAMECLDPVDEPEGGSIYSAGPSTIAELKEALDALEVSYPASANKAALAALFEAASNPDDDTDEDGDLT
jgi:hypothetical protein